jgi:hypothetical protein
MEEIKKREKQRKRLAKVVCVSQVSVMYVSRSQMVALILGVHIEFEQKLCMTTLTNP